MKRTKAQRRADNDTDLTRYAEGKPCQVRIPTICNGNSDTTVLAHIRLAGITGGAQKAPDLLGAWACSACHDEVDRRTRKVELAYAALCHYEGVMRTQYQLLKDGLVKT